MKGSYEIVSINGGKEDSDAIYLLLKNIFSGTLKNDLKLLNYYEEMPISYGNPIIDDCSGGTMELTVHSNQAVVIESQKQTLIKSRHFQDGLCVHSIAEYANSKKNYVVLGRFAYAHVRAERRTAIRVKIQEQSPVTIQADSGASCTARLVDLSVNGIKVLDAPMSFQVGDACTLTFVLLGSSIMAPGIFLRDKVNEKGHFFVFTIQPDSKAEAVISKLIYNRQVEIIQTIKEQIIG
jgi:predicted ribosome-associated RNA-binding protein Tma20